MAAADYYALTQQIYISYFGRPADPRGLEAFATALDAAKAPTEIVAFNTFYKTSVSAQALVNGFGTSTESNTLYSSGDTDTFINSVFLNVLGRPAKLAGLNYWNAEITSGRVTKAGAALAIMAGAFANTTDPVQAELDQAVINNKTAVAINFTNSIDEVNELIAFKGQAAAATARSLLQSVTATTDVAAFQTNIDNTITNLVTAVEDRTGQTFNLTVGTDPITGTAGNDVINASYDVTNSLNTLTGLDNINGGAGNDTLSITNAVGAFTMANAVNLQGVEKITIAGVGAVTADITGASITGVNSLAVTQATAVTLTAGAATDVAVTGATGAIAVNGGNDVSVTAAGAAQAVDIGETAVATGNVNVNHTNQSTADIEVDGGNGVTVTSASATIGQILVGQTINGAKVAADAAKGVVSVNTVGAAYDAADGPVVRGAIMIDGGSTVTVTQTATSSATAAADDITLVGNTITQSAVTVNGTSETTTVSVTQSAAVGAVNATPAVAGTNETQTVQFSALTAGQTVVVNGLTFTASKALTAAEVAGAFANVANGASVGTAAAANGIYSGTFSTIGGTTGAVTTSNGNSSVTFTSAAKADVLPLTLGGTGASITATTDGAPATAAVGGKLGIIGGAVVVNGAITGDDKITDVTLSGYGASSTIASDALTTLSLANSNADVAITNATATTLGLTVNAVGVSADTGVVTTGAKYGTVNLTATGANSFVDLNSSATTLNIGGDKVVSLTGSTLNSLTTVTVTGAAGVTFGDADEADTITSFDASGTSGAVTARINADIATYTGGSGADSVTLTSTTVDKAVTLGAGNDTLTLASGTTALVSDIDGGDGSDTLVLTAADAATVSGTGTFETKISGFEKLSLQAGSASVNLANLDDISYVISANGSAVAAVAETQTFGVTAGTSAAQPEVQLFTINTGSTADATDITVGGVIVDITAGDSIDTIGANIAAQQAAIKAANTNVDTVTYDAAFDTVVVTYLAAAGDVSNIAVVESNGEVAFGTVGEAIKGDTNAGAITVAGVTVNLTAGMTADQVGAAIAAQSAAIALANPTISGVAYDNVADVVTVTYLNTAGDVANTTVVNTSGTGATFTAVSEGNKGVLGMGGGLTLTNVADNGTLELTGAGAGATITLKDATGTADSFNIVAKVGTADLNFGTVAVAGAETVTINADDTSTSAAINTATLTLSDAALKTATVTGDANLTLTLAGNVVALTDLNASALTGKLTASTNGTVAQTITGGSGADMLTANGNGDTLVGGAGNDILVIAGDLTGGGVLIAGSGSNLVTLTGGAGNDQFNVGVATTNVNSYATITDLAAGDSIKFSTGAADFLNAKVTLGETAVFQDFANAAINLTDTGDVAWFQFGGNTYVVENTSNGSSFANGADSIVRITGTIDLTNSAFSSSTDTLYVA